ncbi:antibiotic biosynthesis monooxygenase [Planococcus antarcticus DSM 14505]|uniref:Antibiotic biosynthesis monooxygenase n=1 Tax=Planococcus antarcticus DSM 14505 TaxID=1185653 RepID=A0A1C7DKY6_9BACL|nr:putative quinol monooxygenase [Planococcus antarcticus]ANU11941.1 antibiotic biosynthesis monooxygenase [Planococcus antarcticus DSM 14505]EIM05969.1 antibiotic biosynthesis monooxygenase [Planococcus antarcticus DSM 14505]
MEPILITAILKPKEHMADHLLTELNKVLIASRAEAGCVSYVLHQSIEDDTFVLHETWKDKDALESHVASRHYQEYRTNTADLISKREVFKLKAL